MAITVRLVGELARCAGTEAVELAGGQRSLASVLEELLGLFPRLREELFDAQGHLRYTSLLVTEGRSASWPQDKDRVIREDGQLVITRFYSGG